MRKKQLVFRKEVRWSNEMFPSKNNLSAVWLASLALIPSMGNLGIILTTTSDPLLGAIGLLSLISTAACLGVIITFFSGIRRRVRFIQVE
jgi:hypothetical protein